MGDGAVDGAEKCQGRRNGRIGGGWGQNDPGTGYRKRAERAGPGDVAFAWLFPFVGGN